MGSRRRALSSGEKALGALVVGGLAWAAWSYATGGIVYTVATVSLDSDRSIKLVREGIGRTGAFAPIVYVVAVVVEVLVAPIPGTLLYAPGGAIFGGLVGGSLSLCGNVIGASIATWLGAMFGARVLGPTARPDLAALAERIRRNGLVVVTLLRLNPLTSSDIVSYAAGMVGIPVWRVALGTAIGMAPLCYAQSFASEWILRVIPGAGTVFLTLGVAYVVVVLWWLAKPRDSHTG